MKHTCPHCGAAREINDQQIPPQGMSVQCFNCFGTFTVSASAAASSAGVSAQPVASPSSGDDLFETRGSFGFDLGGGREPAQPASRGVIAPPPPPAPSLSPPVPAPQIKPKVSSAPITPSWSAGSAGENLPQPVESRRAPLKVFSATPPPMLNDPPEPSAVQSAPPESPELFAVQSAPPESPELFATQSAPPESPELFATQSRAPESPELFATQSRAPESPELFATQSRDPESPELAETMLHTPASPELKASGTVGALEFGGLNDLFDQGDEEIETIFDTSEQGKQAVLDANRLQSSEEATLLEPPSAQSAIFSDQAVFSSGGMFDFGADRGFNFDDPGGSSLGFGAEEVSTPTPPPFEASSLKESGAADDGAMDHDAEPTINMSPGSLPIDAPPIMFDMGESQTPAPDVDASADELMAIEVEEDDEPDELEAEEESAEDEVSSDTPSQSKSSGGKGLLLLALAAVLIGYLITQQPDRVSQLIGPEYSEMFGLGSSGERPYEGPMNGQRGVRRGVPRVGSGAGSGVGATNMNGNDPRATGAQGQPSGLGSSDSTSASLRAISQAARGGQSQGSQGSRNMGSSPAQTSAQTQAQKTPQRPAQTPAQKADQSASESSWFSPLAAISAAFRQSDKITKHRDQLTTPSPLDTEGFNQASGSLKTAQGDDLVQRAEEVGLGVLHFNMPGMVWRREVLNQAQALTPEQAQTPAGERTLAATQLIYDVEGATERAIAIGHAQPRDPAAQELMGHAYLKRGQKYEAQRAFERAYKLDPNRARAQQKFAQIAARNGDLPAANRALNSLIKAGRGAPSVQQTLAEVKLSQGKGDEAFAWISNLMKTDPGRLSSQDQAATLSTLVRALDQEIESTRDRGGEASDEDEAKLVSYERAQRAALEEIVKLNPDDQQSLDKLLRRDESSKRYKSALKQVQRLRGESGDSATLMLKEFKLLKQLARHDKARALLDQMLKQHDDKPVVHLTEGEYYINKGDYTKARAALRRARRLAPAAPEPILALAKLLVKDSRAKEAKAFLERESADRPWSAKLHSGLGDFKLQIAQTTGQRGMFAEAEDAYNRALTIDPSLSEARVQRARAQLRLDKPQQALADLKWLKEQGYQGGLDFEFGRAQQALGNVRSAQNYFKRVLKKDREHVEALRAMGSLKQAERKTAEAKQYYEDALAVNSRDPFTRYELGRIALKERNASQAVEHLRIATEVKEQDPMLQYWYGRALEKAKGPNTADNIREAYEKSVDLLPDNAKDAPPELCDAYYRVGLVHAKSGNALDDFTRASECNPKRADIWTRLAESYEKLGNREEMMRHYKRALKQNRNYVPALLGTARSQLNEIPPRTKEARRALKKVLKRDKKNADAHFLLCKVTQSTSRRKARSYCKRYLKLAPKGRYARIAKEIVRSL